MLSNSRIQFNVLFQPEPEGGFTVIVPSLPGCVTFGKNLDEARIMAKDAIKGYIVSLKKHKELIPSDSQNFIGMVEVPIKRSLAYA